MQRIVNSKTFWYIITVLFFTYHFWLFADTLFNIVTNKHVLYYSPIIEELPTEYFNNL